MCLLLVGITLRMAPFIDDMGEWNFPSVISISNDFPFMHCDKHRSGLKNERTLKLMKRWNDEKTSLFYVCLFASLPYYNIHGLGLFIPFWTFIRLIPSYHSFPPPHAASLYSLKRPHFQLKTMRYWRQKKNSHRVFEQSRTVISSPLEARRQNNIAKIWIIQNARLS